MLEVGLGGTLDATNVIDPAVSVIAPLDYEHTANPWRHDGRNRREQGGHHQAGPAGRHCRATGRRTRRDRARAAACDRARCWWRDAIRHRRTDRDFAATGPWGEVAHLRTRLAGRHQAENATLAIAAVHASGGTSATPRSGQAWRGDPAGAVRGGPARIRPGRDHRWRPLRRSAAVLAAALRDRHPDTAAPLIVAGMLGDKSPGSVLPPLAAIASRWIATAPASPRARPPPNSRPRSPPSAPASPPRAPSPTRSSRRSARVTR